MQFYWKSSQANPICREREGTKWLFEVNGDNLSNKCLYFSGLKVTIIIFKVVHSVPYILKSIIIQLEFNPISLSIIYFGSSKVPIISTFLKNIFCTSNKTMKPYCVLISLLTYHFTVNFYDPFPNMILTELVFARSGYLGEQRGEIDRSRSKRNKKSQGRKTWTKHCNYYMKKNIYSESRSYLIKPEQWNKTVEVLQKYHLYHSMSLVYNAESAR